MNIERSVKLIALFTYAIAFLSIVLAVSLIAYKLDPTLFESKVVDPKTWKPRNIDQDLPKGREGQLIKYGYLLVSETPRFIGPSAKNPDMRYAGNNLACENCHLQAGTQQGSASWVGITNRFPQFKGRENKMITVEDRVNGCMERSMNGQPLPDDSKQMEAIVAYMEWLSEDVPESRASDFIGFPGIDIPEKAADPVLGHAIYEQECQLCHGPKGQGVWNTDSTKGYLYPPLWGKDTYNHGAGMHRVLTAAQFIRFNMPWQQATWDSPKLSNEEAYHVAAYINSFERPLKENTKNDFPDLKYKPVSTPYGPWADEFSEEQHKYGPFQPIMAYYEKEYNLKKTK